jgi:hypothetical protein
LRVLMIFICRSSKDIRIGLFVAGARRPKRDSIEGLIQKDSWRRGFVLAHVTFIYDSAFKVNFLY